MGNNEKLLTVGEIATRLGLSIYRVQYILKSRGIQPSNRAGLLRVFDERALEAVERAASGADRPSIAGTKGGDDAA